MKVLSIVLSIVLLLVFSAPLMADTNATESLDLLFGYQPPNYRDKWIECVDNLVSVSDMCRENNRVLNEELEKSNKANDFLTILGIIVVYMVATD